MAAKRAALAAGLLEPEARRVACRVAISNVNLLQAIAQAKRPLMLPAPAVTIESIGFNAIPAVLREAERELA